MSGRAVRRALQRQREAELLSQEPASESESDSPPPQKQSLFALLNAADADQAASDDDEPEASDEEPAPEPEKGSTPAPKKKKNKGKKKKKKVAAAAKELEEEDSDDDIDRALRDLEIAAPAAGKKEKAPVEEGEVRLADVLKVDSRNLDAGNEMRKLFGKDALRGDNDGGQRGGGRARGGRQGGRGLTGGRKNTFVQPKEEWPNVSSGGLGMEVVSDGDFTSEPGVTEFAFVHSRAYQDVQRQFMMCVASMDPNRLINLLQHNPYHITTLLQASEIFHHQRDFTIAGDLQERTLFSLGRSLHSSFPQKLAEGTARLSFRRPENRELFLSAWRYIKNLSQRGTWRTASEFALLILALDPLNDPYDISLLLDFLALKANQPTRFLALAEHPALRSKYADLPNIAFSSALAHLQLENPTAAMEYLSKAATKFPWVPTLLYQELSIDATLPPALWGTQPPSPRQDLLAKLYITRSADLWKSPAAKQLLEDTCQRIYNLPKKPLLADAEAEIDQNLARHVVLSEIPALVQLLPKKWTSRESPAFDPLPPDGEVRSYDPTPPMAEGSPMDGIHDANAFATFLRSVLPWFRMEGEGQAPEGEGPVVGGRQLGREDLRRLRGELEQAGVDVEQLVRDNEREEREMREGGVEREAEQ